MELAEPCQFSASRKSTNHAAGPGTSRQQPKSIHLGKVPNSSGATGRHVISREGWRGRMSEADGGHAGAGDVWGMAYFPVKAKGGKDPTRPSVHHDFQESCGRGG